MKPDNGGWILKRFKMKREIIWTDIDGIVKIDQLEDKIYKLEKENKRLKRNLRKLKKRKR